MWGHDRCPVRLLERGEAMRAEMIREIPDRAEEWREVVITPPTVTFADRAAIDVGGREVELRYLGRGHTDTDIVLTVPSVGVMFAGDLLENGAAPYFGDGYPLDWPATLEALIALSSGAVVPGHGDVADVAFARRSLEEIRVIADLGRRGRGDRALPGGRRGSSAVSAGPGAGGHRTSGRAGPRRARRRLAGSLSRPWRCGRTGRSGRTRPPPGGRRVSGGR